MIPFGVTFCVVHFGVTFWCYLLVLPFILSEYAWWSVAQGGGCNARRENGISARRQSFDGTSFIFIFILWKFIFFISLSCDLGNGSYLLLLPALVQLFAFGCYLKIKKHICFFFLNIPIWPTLLNNASVPLSSLVIYHLSANKKLLDTGWVPCCSSAEKPEFAHLMVHPSPPTKIFK